MANEAASQAAADGVAPGVAEPLDGWRLIEASAGTGKTWTICGLVVRLLLERALELPQILIVTFTTAAAAELRGRVRERIRDALTRLQDPSGDTKDSYLDPLLQRLGAFDDPTRAHALAGRLDRALRRFDEAAVYTIHGFCQRALAEWPLSVGEVPRPEIVADDAALRLQVAQDFWRRRVAVDHAAGPAFGALLERRRDDPESWARRLAERLRQPLARCRWPDVDPVESDRPTAAGEDPLAALAAAHAAFVEAWAHHGTAALALLEGSIDALHRATYKPSSVEAARAGGEALATMPWSALGSGRLPAGVELLSADRLARATKKGQATPRHPLYDRVAALIGAQAPAVAALERQRLALLREFIEAGPERMRIARRAQHVGAFDDLLDGLHRALTDPARGPALAGALRARYRAALIDEFQDTDPLQYAIFRALYPNAHGPVVLVGDPKQAIYRFRGADLPTYLLARSQASGDRIELTANQRATAGLIHAVNVLFSRHRRPLMDPRLEVAPVHRGAKPLPELVDSTPPTSDPGPALTLWSLPRAPDGGALPLAPARDAVAAATAGEVARLLDAGRQRRLTLGGRPLDGGDIAVLVRSHRQGRLMRRALAALGVASVELSPASVFTSPDAEALDQVLSAVLDPTHAPRLRRALATDWLGWNAHALHALADDDDASAALLRRFVGHRERWRAQGSAAMLRRLLRDEGVLRRLLARPDGERRLTDVLHLVEALQQAEDARGSPEGLLRWLQAQRQDPPPDDHLQLRLESDRHLVQVVTVHRSKGLEYPIVFCPYLWDMAPAPPVPGAPCSYHDDDGTQVLDFRPDAAQDPDVRPRIALEEASESLRLIYVALTRAVHRCFVVVGTHGQGARRSTAVSGRSALNWLVAGGGDPSDWLRTNASATPEAVAAGWASMADAAAPHATLLPLPGPGAPLPATPDAPGTSVALVPPPVRPIGWRIGSYSALMRGADRPDIPAPGEDGDTPSVARDHDLRVDGRPATDGSEGRVSDVHRTASAEGGDDGDGGDPSDADENDVRRFPRGAQAGECLHALFERADLSRPSRWPDAIAQALSLRPPRSGPADPVWPRQLGRLLNDLTGTPLPQGLRLDRVTPERRLAELEFHLPVARLTGPTLEAALAGHGYATPTTAFAPLHGYLRGFIDLVFEQDGRYHLLDWKSNHLGWSEARYAPDALSGVVRERGYELQALLYAVALHRHLQRRLPGYDYDHHFGQLMVVFVRGVRPAWPGAGTWSHRPARAAVEALSALLEPTPAAGAGRPPPRLP